MNDSTPTHPILADTVVAIRRPGFYTKKIPCCLLLMDSKDHMVVSLDKSATVIWELCERPRTIGELIAVIRGETSDREVTRRDVCRVLDTLNVYNAIDLRFTDG